MSGHSHFATIKRQKEAKDSVRGKIFSRHARAIAIAVKEGGSGDPEFNYKLRMVVESAKSDNMPKTNIERAIAAGGSAEHVEQITYEGFGPGGFSVIVATATDNRNRTSQEIKNLFEKAGGRFGGPGSVAFNFDSKGFILVKKEGNSDDQMLKLIDGGVEDMVESQDGIEVYVAPNDLFEKRKALEENGFTILKMELIEKPKMFTEIKDKADIEKAIKFLDTIEDQDDVQKVFTNLEVPEDLPLND